jgi:hypothetical protein
MDEGQIQFLLGKMDSKIDTLLKANEEAKQHTISLELRIAKLESWHWKMVGAGTAASAFVSFIIKYLGH